MSVFKEFLVHTGNYFAGQSLLLLAGFISMPIMTRLLTKEEYGMMSIVFLTITCIGTVAHLGFPLSIPRFYAEYKKHGEASLRKFCSNILYGSFFSGTLVAFLTMLIICIFEKNDSMSNFFYYLKFCTILVVIRIVNNTGKEIYRAEKKHLLYNVISVIERCGSLFLSIVLLYFYKSIFGVFLGTILAEGVVSIIVLTYCLVDRKIVLVRLSRDLIAEANKYGLPFVLAGASAFILDSGDRYIIQYFLNSEAVANYSVAYDASNCLANVIITPIRLAIVPIIFSLWANQGDEATSAFTSKALKYIFFLIIPIIFAFSLLGKEVITILASTKYAASSELIPCMVAGVLIGGLDFVLSSGLRAQKRTNVLALIVLFSCIVNIILNCIFVPYYGLQSASVITLITYLLRAILSYKFSSKYLSINIDIISILKSFSASTIMAITILFIDNLSYTMAINIALKILFGFLCYVIILLTLDREFREDLALVSKGEKLLHRS